MSGCASTCYVRESQHVKSVVRTDRVKVRVWVHKSRIAGLGLFAILHDKFANAPFPNRLTLVIEKYPG